jgi:hypothetical protein
MNNKDTKRMQELAGIKPSSKLSSVFKQVYKNNIKISNDIESLTNLLKEHKNVNNRKS